MYELWNNGTPYPKYEDIKKVGGIEYEILFDAITGQYQFSLGTAIVRYKNRIYCSWANSWRGENDNNTILAEKVSYDGGNSWENYRRISKKEEGFGRSHGVYFRYNDRLYVFCPKADFDKNQYPNLKTESYVLNENGEYEYLGIVLDDAFWPILQRHNFRSELHKASFVFQHSQ